MSAASVRIRDYDALRDALIRRRITLQMSIDDLAAASGLPLACVRGIEAGRICLNPVTLPAMLSGLRLAMHVAERPQKIAA